MLHRLGEARQAARKTPPPRRAATAPLRLALAALVLAAALPCAVAGRAGRFPMLAQAVPLPKPLPKLPPKPAIIYRWVPLNRVQRRQAEQMLSIFENSSLLPDYGYAENLDDGRGVTFGRSGFCTGTSDGLQVVREYLRLQRRPNPLARFLPVLEAIDKAGGGDSPLLRGPAQTAFIQAVKLASADPLFRRAQDVVNDQQYFRPSQDLAASLGLRSALSKAQLYDAWVEHGQADPDDLRTYPVSANGMADIVSRQLRGSPLTGVDEGRWLQRFLELRRNLLLRAGGDWADGVQRVDLYIWLLQLRAVNLDRPLSLSYDSCRPDRLPGPCLPQSRALVQPLRIGGWDYGDFELR